MTGLPFQLRVPGSGPVIEAPADGDQIAWDAALLRWVFIPGGGVHPVTSVFGRVGAVVAQDGDYTFALLGGDLSNSDTAELDTTLVLKPDGAGNVQWVAEAPSSATGNNLAGPGQVYAGNSGPGVLDFRSIISGAVDRITVTQNALDLTLTLPNVRFGGGFVSIGIGATAVVSGGSTLMGNNAGTNMAGGSSDTGYGNGVLSSCTTGNGNDAFGNGCLTSCTIGNENTAFGSNGLQNVTTGNGNTSLNAPALTLVTGDGNLMIGPLADVPAAGTDGYLNVEGLVTGDIPNKRLAFTPNTLAEVLAQTAKNHFYSNLDTVAPRALQTIGANAATVREFVSNRNPNGSITGNPGDVLTRSDGVNSTKWQHQGAAADNTSWVEFAFGAAGLSAWDHIIETVADLPALVAGAHILTTGSWAFKNSIDLLGNKIEIPTGVTVLLASMGDTKVITSSRAGEVVEFQDGSAGRCWNLAVTNGNASALSAAMRIVTDLNLYFDGCDFSAGSGFAVDFSALSSARTFWNQCFIHNSATGVEIGNAGNESHWVNCVFEGLTTVFDVQASSGLFIQGGRMDNFTDGVAINGSMSTLAIADMEFENGQDGIDYNAGTVNRASVIGTTCVNMTEMIRWAAASIPTLGLNLVGNTWNIASPLSGFTEASARVNLKACVDSSGQMSETAIVP